MPSFDFFQHWYPLLPIEDLEPHKPITATLLGIPLVIWYSPRSKTFQVFIEFLKWFDRYCDGKIPWDQADVSTTTQSILFPPREVLLDRYHQHTQHCSSCRTALKTIKLWQWLLLSYFIATISIVAVLPDHLRVSWGLGFMISAIIGLVIAAGLRFWLMPKFYFVDYVHSER